MNWLLDSLRTGPASSIAFRTLSSEEIKRLSVVKITSSDSFTVLGHPKPGGLHDESMGPTERLGDCVTCGLKYIECPGHLGCIELPLLVVNPLFHSVVRDILKMSCLKCFKILIPSYFKYLLIGQLKLLDKGCFSESVEMAQHFSDFDIPWDRQKDIDLKLLVSCIEQYVDEILSRNYDLSREVRGEPELRNFFIKSARSRVCKLKLCPYCNCSWSVISYAQNKLIVNRSKLETGVVSKGNMISEYLFPNESNEILKRIWINEAEFMKALFPMLEFTNEPDPIDAFFMKVIAVTPNNARPFSCLDNHIHEHAITLMYNKILEACLDIKTLIVVMNNKSNVDSLSDLRKDLVKSLRGDNYAEKLRFAWENLQEYVNALVDADFKKLRIQPLGLKQIIEKKEGCIRMNMMGKRVNFAARTVITPDPYLNVNEVGIPKEFAKKLTFPVPVTPWNVVELRKRVNNGPSGYPGANYVDYEDGTRVRLNENDAVQRRSIANTLLTPGYMKNGLKGVKVVQRHLRNGDVVLLNRQPTLHRPSIMAHIVRVLEGEKTFRLHYANCKSYNADFDGDEMNIHIPQHQVARSEAIHLANVFNNYLVPKDGSPLSGLIQDHIVSGVLMTIRGKMFNRRDYMQLVYQALSFVDGDIRILKPCIIKPVECWSGKQIISTIIINLIPKGASLINLTSTAKISNKAWFTSDSRPWRAGGTPFGSSITMSESEVIIRQGELLSGVFDKMHYGATPYSLVHCMYELYGGEVSNSFLSSLSKLFTGFLQMEGFSLGVEDILVSKKADKKRAKLIKRARMLGDEIVASVFHESLKPEDLKENLSVMYSRDPMFKIIVDHKYKTYLDTITNRINRICIRDGLLKHFPSNALQLMVQSGAKGSTVNTMQISSLLGQIELEGKRPPLMISGKALPSFPLFDTSPRAGGFVDGRFMTGIKPQEFFFHCMAGREGLIDTAVKTSRSGYLQRCLVKHLEGVTVQYDRTVRDSDGSVIQFLYGEDGLEVTKCQFLKNDQLPFLVDNMDAVRDPQILETYTNDKKMFKKVKSYKKKIKAWRSAGSPKTRSTPFLRFCDDKKESIKSFISSNINPQTGREYQSDTLCNMWHELSEEEKQKYVEFKELRPDPIISQLHPDKYYASIPEKLEEMMEIYLKNNKPVVHERSIRRMVYEKYICSMCPPGEPVGMLAAQSVGEPSTQMTLNTFHFAGRGEMNVTLGIPRLIEILMTASRNIKTPCMVIPFKPYNNQKKFEKRADRLRRHLSRITLADVLHKIEVTEKIEVAPVRLKIYILKMFFLPHEAYRDRTKLTPKEILNYIENKFFKRLVAIMKAKRMRKGFDISAAENNEKDGDVGKDEDGDDNDDVGMSTKKQHKKKGVLDEISNNCDSDLETNDSDNEGADAAKRRTRHEDDQQYSEEEDEKVKEEVQESDVDSDKQSEKDSQEEKSDLNELNEEVKDSKEKAGKKRPKFVTKHHAMDYKYDKISYQWCQVTVGFEVCYGHIDLSSRLKELAEISVIHEVPGIRKAIIHTKSSGEVILRTDGINIDEMYNYNNLLDLKRIYTNDIQVVASMYGIDAASNVIVKEIQEVFKVYGITVDSRHLTLVAAYMTFDGTYQPLSRKCMVSSASPLQAMSFESSLRVLQSAVLHARTDKLKNPSSRLIMGQPIRAGTSAFDLFYKIKELT